MPSLLRFRLPAVAPPLGRVAQRLPPAAALFLYGFGYAFATTGCTLPIYVSIIVLPLTGGYGGAALVTFASFAVAMAFMMILTSLLVGLAKEGKRASPTPGLDRVDQTGERRDADRGRTLYLGYYYIAAGM